jgi:hypothetical protein
MPWDIEVSDEFRDWYNGLDDDETDSVDRAIELLEREGPNLGRPSAPLIEHQSRHQKMKELRSSAKVDHIAFCLFSIRAAALI